MAWTSPAMTSPRRTFAASVDQPDARRLILLSVIVETPIATKCFMLGAADTHLPLEARAIAYDVAARSSSPPLEGRLAALLNQCDLAISVACFSRLRCRADRRTGSRCCLRSYTPRSGDPRRRSGVMSREVDEGDVGGARAGRLPRLRCRESRIST
jgi:hypothetical protein